MNGFLPIVDVDTVYATAVDMMSLSAFAFKYFPK